VSSFRGARTKPASGIKGSKGGPASQPRMRLPKMPAPPEASELQEQSSIYLRERNKQMRAKRLRAEMELAFDRNQLIEKALVEKQLAYLLIGMRQKILALPGKLRLKFGEERFPHEMVEATKFMVTEILSSVFQLPQAADPNWLEKLEEDD
jgi:hypothetical protein